MNLANDHRRSLMTVCDCSQGYVDDGGVQEDCVAGSVSDVARLVRRVHRWCGAR
jgi:hypothetical protein